MKRNKRILGVLVSIMTSVFAFSQQFEYAQQFGDYTAGNQSHSSPHVFYSDSLNLFLACGNFQERIFFDQNEFYALNIEPGERSGYVVIYDEDLDHEESFLGGSINGSGVLVGEDAIIGGIFVQDEDFEKYNENNSPTECLGERSAFLASYNYDGDLNWLHTLSHEYLEASVTSLNISDNKLYATLYISFDVPSDETAPIGLSFGNEELLFNDFSTSTLLLLVMDAQGNIERTESIKSDNYDLSLTEVLMQDDKWYLGCVLDSGSVEVGLNEQEVLLEYDRSRNSVILEYDSETLELENYMSFSRPDSQWGIRIREFAKSKMNEDFFIYFGPSWDGDLVFENMTGLNQLIPSDTLFGFLGRVNPDHGLVWRSDILIQAGSLESLTEDLNGNIWSNISFHDSLFINDSLIIYNEDPYAKNALLALDLNGDFEFAEAFNSTYYDFYTQNSFTVVDDFYFYGNYEGLQDWDVSEGYFWLDNPYNNPTGFLVKYSLPEKIPELLVSKSAVINEGDSYQNMRLAFTDAPNEVVSLGIYPTDQMDVGLGEGVPYYHTFFPGEQSFLDLNVKAHDDDLIEGNHLGTVVVEIIGEDNHDYLESLNLVFYIGDNEVLAVTDNERYLAFMIAYPNPVGEYCILELNEDFQVEPLIEVYSSLGARLKINYEAMDDTKLKLDFSDIPSGIYSIRVVKDDSLEVTRTVVKL